MKIKRFTAANMQAGLKAIGEALGPEAVILSNRRLQNGLEIVAGVDEAEFQRYQASKPAPESTSDIIKAKANRAESLDKETMQELFSAMSTKNQNAFGASMTAPVNRRQESEAELARLQSKPVKKTPARTVDPWANQATLAEPEVRAVPKENIERLMVSELRQEIDSLKDLLREQKEQLKEPVQITAMSPQYERLESRLLTLGFSESLTAKLLSHYDREDSLDSNWRKVMNRVASALPVPLYDPLTLGGVFALTGPTGAGKTTTIAKIAAHATKDHGAASIAVISMDWFQVGGQEILRSVTDILGVEFFPLTENDSLADTLDKLSHKHLVLIDTSGSAEALQHWNKLTRTDPVVRQAQMLLVVPATMHPAAIKQFIAQHERQQFSGAVLSKLDESACFGGILEPVLKHRWPVWYCTTGQNIPQDIEQADSKRLIRRLIKGLSNESLKVASAV